ETIFVGGSDNQVRLSHRSLIRLIKASKGPVLSVVFAPDGTKLASGAGDKTVQLWNLTDGASLQSFTGSTQGLSNVAVSNDGKLLAACGAEKFVRVWQIADGVALHSIALPVPARDVHFSADSTKLVAGCDDNIVRVWDLRSGKLLELFKGHTGAVSGVRFAADNKTIISGSADKQLRVWKLSAQKVFVAESSQVKDAVFSADGKHILTGGKEKIIKLWDPSGKLVRSLTGCASEITRLARSSDGQMVACFGGANAQAKIVYLWNLAAQENTPAHVLTAPNKVTSLSFSADHKKLAIGSSDKHLRIYRTQDMLLLEDITVPADVKDVVFAPDNKTLVSAAAGNQALVLSDSLLQVIAGHQGAVTCLAYSPDGKSLISGGADKSVRQWDLVSGKQTHAYEGNTAAVTSLSISRDGKRIATGSADHSARLWNLAANAGGGNVKKVQPLSAITHPAAVLSVGFNPDGSRLTTGSADNMIRIWDIATGKELERLAGHSKPVHAVCFSPDGRTIVSGSEDKTARRWTTSVLRFTQAHPHAIRSLKFSADGAQLFSIGKQNAVSRWSTAGLKPIGKFEGATAPLNSLAISRKGTIVVAGGDDQHVRVWNADDGKLLAAIKTPSPITSLILDNAGAKVITAGADKIIRNFALVKQGEKHQLSLTHQAEGHTEAITALAMGA
ncbi:MAG: hypothetical protein IH991_25855, partial [Planctomycetes bacterium]|nr:hypothetical protein [Planctomycetota bacterium]